jgi:holliday junction DNA helicase RuvA
MYEFLRGRVAQRHLQDIALDVGGIGFALEAPLSTSENLKPGDDVTLWVHHHVREDQQKLFAFATLDERRLFRLLQKVTGIGPGVALTMLSRARVADICEAIAHERIDVLRSLKGVGPKTAQRLVTELRDAVATIGVEVGDVPVKAAAGFNEDAVQALEVLGCPPKAARDAVAKVTRAETGLPLETIVRRALKEVWPGQ